MIRIKIDYKKKECFIHNDVVDRDVDELDEEANESHDGEADGGGESDLLKLFVKKSKIIIRNHKKTQE